MAGIAYCASPSRQYAWPLFSTFAESAGMSYTFITLASPVGELKLVANGSTTGSHPLGKRQTGPGAAWADARGAG